MEPYQLRMIKEKTELDIKIVELVKFIYSDKFLELVTDEEQGYMEHQLQLMMAYSKILGQRVALFIKHKPKGIKGGLNKLWK